MLGVIGIPASPKANTRIQMCSADTTPGSLPEHHRLCSNLHRCWFRHSHTSSSHLCNRWRWWVTVGLFCSARSLRKEPNRVAGAAPRRSRFGIFCAYLLIFLRIDFPNLLPYQTGGLALTLSAKILTASTVLNAVSKLADMNCAVIHSRAGGERGLFVEHD